MPIQTNSPPLSKEEYETGWRKLHWAAGRDLHGVALCPLRQQGGGGGQGGIRHPHVRQRLAAAADMAWPGRIRAAVRCRRCTISGAPARRPSTFWRPISIFQYFDELCERFTRNGNPLFIPETSANAANALVAFGKYNAIGYSPFVIERSVSADSELAADLPSDCPDGAGDRGAPGQGHHRRPCG